MPDERAPEARQRHELRVRVAEADLDERRHVNNVVYLRWAQEIATAHWRALATPESLETLAWVALRHEIDYLAPAMLGDELLVRTWVGQADGLAFERFVEVIRDGRTLAKARTLWCPVDIHTGRPRRPDPETRARFSTNAPTHA